MTTQTTKRKNVGDNPANKTQNDMASAATPDSFLSKLWIDGFAGISKGGLFQVTPGYVDLKKAPGTSSQTSTLGFRQTMDDILHLRYFFFSPNLVWFSIALALHYFFPYDMVSAKKGWALDWVGKRFLLNYSSCFAYYAFFHAQLYWFNAAKRKFSASTPTAGNMAHNLYYWSLAIVQWTFWEAVMVRMWATGKVSFVSDAKLLEGDPYTVATTAFWILAIPIWRDLHFYIAHRFIHIRAVYKYVHSLHHRNADPEPFSGMTMHPVEHLYYFSNAFTPSLYLHLSPLIFLWNFVHLTFAPGAGHSGWEDHFQADQYHYVHHAKFECNYGSPMSAFIDQTFGTFREKLGKTEEYKGEYDNSYESAKKDKVWSATGYLGLPATWDHGVYTAYWMSLFAFAFWAFVSNATDGITSFESFGVQVSVAKASAFTLAFGPVFVALALNKLSGDRLNWRWPFMKESVVGVFGLFLVLGFFACLLPVYHATLWSLQV